MLGISKMMNFDGIAKERLCVVSAAVMRVFGLASLDRWSEGRCLNDVYNEREGGVPGDEPKEARYINPKVCRRHLRRAPRLRMQHALK